MKHAKTRCPNRIHRSLKPGRAIRRVRVSHLLLALWVALFIGQPLMADNGNIRLTLANDFLATNELDDDLYTAALELEFQRGEYRIFFGENIFTDSDHDVRFDETYLRLERPFRPFGQWHTAASIGAVHVGEGLLGQSTQNAIHRLIGDDEVDFDYVDSNRVYPTLGFRFFRPLPAWRALRLDFHADLYNAFSFQGHAALGTRAHWKATEVASFDFGVGIRYSWTEFEALEARIADWGPTWEAGVTLWNRVTLAWDYNSFGTKSQHFNIHYNLKFKDRPDSTPPSARRARFSQN